MHNFSKLFLSIAGLKIYWEGLITANSIAYTLKWIGLLWIYTRARHTLTGFSCLSSLTWIFTQALFLWAQRFHEAHARTQPHPAMKVSLSPDLPPALLVHGVTPQTWHMLQQPCIQPCLLPLLKQPLGSLQTWPMMLYMGLLMDAAPLMALPSCSAAVLLSERALSCLCSALGSYSSTDQWTILFWTGPDPSNQWLLMLPGKQVHEPRIFPQQIYVQYKQIRYKLMFAWILWIVFNASEF